MAVEARRGCGFRKVGGLYLVSGGAGVPCDRLPIPLTVCPVCSHGFKQARGWTWTDVNGLVGGPHEGCRDEFQPCPLCTDPKSIGKAGMIWIGEKFYKTPAEFQKEGMALGFSRRIKALPRGFKVGETWVLLAHPNTIKAWTCPECEHTLDTHGDGVCRWMPAEGADAVCQCTATPAKFRPGIFTLWKPSRVEKILPESQRGGPEEAKCLEQGITPVFVPDDDKDHQGTAYDREEDEEPAEVSAA